jgi:hypothetical protein
MGRAWEENYMNRLVELQLRKLKKLQAKVDKKYPLEESNSIESIDTTQKIDKPNKNDKA